MVDAQEIDAQFAHQAQVRAQLLRGADEIPRRVRAERAVGRPLEEEFFLAPEERIWRAPEPARGWWQKG